MRFCAEGLRPSGVRSFVAGFLRQFSQAADFQLKLRLQLTWRGGYNLLLRGITPTQRKLRCGHERIPP